MTCRLLFLVALLAVLGGCGLSSAGTWDDDPNNWRRAFGVDKSPDVVVVHSRYWRSAHWTYEFCYYFEIEPNDRLKQQFIRDHGLTRRPDELGSAYRNSVGETPAWFAPKATDRYEVWTNSADCQLFVDKDTGALFLSDCLL